MESPTNTFSKHIVHAASGDPAEIAAIHAEVEAKYADLATGTKMYLSPMAVSQILILVKKIRQSMEMFSELPTRVQEEKAYLQLNACKLILQLCQPLIWFACGRYVLETTLYAILSMEAVINLCTVRHSSFRMKLYATAFYSALSQNRTDEAYNILLRGTTEIQNLWDREHLDPPVPAEHVRQLLDCKRDLLVMKLVTDAFRDPESLDFGDSKLDTYLNQLKGEVAEATGDMTFRDRCICEFVRVHLLSSGNKNETYMRRGQVFVAALLRFAQTASTASKSIHLSRRACVEISFLVLYDGYLGDEERQAAMKFVAQMAEEGPPPASPSSSTSQKEDQGEHEDKLRLLLDLHEASLHPLTTTSTEADLQPLRRLFQRVQDMVFRPYSYRIQSLLALVGMEVFKKIVYTPLQYALSDSSTAPTSTLHLLSTALSMAMQCLEPASLYDPVFIIALSLTLGNLYYTLHEYRPCIATMKQALVLLDQVRDVLVDVRLVMPEEVRDVLALQRQSITCRSSLFDWFDAKKRLGANAYAGYGLFGSGHSAVEVVDMALSQLHIDVYALYFRAELVYYKRAREGRSSSSSPSSATVTASVSGKVEDWPIVRSLLRSLRHNRYASSLLLLEMAKLAGGEGEEDGDGAGATTLLRAAHQAIEEAEQAEAKLLQTNAPLRLQTLQSFPAPIILARSSRYVYVVPVQCAALREVQYYRVFGKESGAGTTVSTHSHSLPGCAQRVPHIPPATSFGALAARTFPRSGETVHGSADPAQISQTSQQLRQSLVCLGPLPRGQSFLFASTAWTKHDQLVDGRLSPCTAEVTTAHPLDTRYLGQLVLRTLLEMLARKASSNSSSKSREKVDLLLQRVFQQCIARDYLHPVPRLAELSLSSGGRLLSPPLPRQWDSHQLAWVSSADCVQACTAYLAYLRACFRPFQPRRGRLALRGIGPDSDVDVVDLRASPVEVQLWSLLAQLQRLLSVAAGCGASEVVQQAVLLVHQVVHDARRWETRPVSPASSVASVLQKALYAALLAVRTVPLRQWSLSVQQAYASLYLHLLDLAAATGQTRPLRPLLDPLYPAPASAQEVKACLSSAGREDWDRLRGQWRALDALLQKLPASLRAAPRSVLKALLQEGEEKAGEDGLSLVEGLLAGQAASLQAALSLLESRPEGNYSQTLQRLVELVQIARGRGGPQAARQICQTLPAVHACLASPLQALLPLPSSNNSNSGSGGAGGGAPPPPLVLLASLADLPKHRQTCLAAAAPAAAAANAPPAAKGKQAAPTPAAAAATAAGSEVSPRNPYAEAEAGWTDDQREAEVRRQAACLAQLAACLLPDLPPATALVPPRQGPQAWAPVDQLHRLQTASPPSGEERGDEDGLPLLSEPAQHDLQHAAWVVCLAARGGLADTAINAFLRLHQTATLAWLSPQVLARQLAAPLGDLLRDAVEGIVSAAVSLAEPLLSPSLADALHHHAVTASLLADAPEGESAAAPERKCQLREVEDRLLLLRDGYTFFLQVLYLARPPAWPLPPPEEEAEKAGEGERALGGDYERLLPRSLSLLCLYGVISSTRPSTAARATAQQVLHALHPYLADMQAGVVHVYAAHHAAAVEALAAFVEAFRLAQSKQRRRKLKINRLEKDDEELAFEEQQRVLQAVIDVRKERLQVQQAKQINLEEIAAAIEQRGEAMRVRVWTLKQRLSGVLARLASSSSSSSVRKLTASPTGLTNNTAASRPEEEEDEEMVSLQRDYSKCVEYLRQTQQVGWLAEVLEDWSLLAVATQQWAVLRVCVNDVIDGYFSSYQAIEDFPRILSSFAWSNQEHAKVSDLSRLVVACGHFIRYGLGDRRQCQRYALLASHLCQVMLADGQAHPRETVGCLVYSLRTLGEGEWDWNYRHIDVSTFLEGLVQCAKTLLTASRQYREAAPLLCLGEWIAARWMHSPRHVLRLRCARVQCAIGMQAMAEAVSLLSTLSQAVQAARRHKLDEGRGDKEEGEGEDFQVAVNGLFFGKNCPVFNNAVGPTASLPDSTATTASATTTAAAAPAAAPANAKAGKGGAAPAPAAAAAASTSSGMLYVNAQVIDWVAAFPTQWEAYTKTWTEEGLRLCIPEAYLTERQRQAYQSRLAAQAAALAAQAADPKATKAGKGQPAAAAAAATETNPQACLPWVSVVDPWDSLRLTYLAAWWIHSLLLATSSSLTSPGASPVQETLISHISTLLARGRDQLFALQDPSAMETVDDCLLEKLFPPATAASSSSSSSSSSAAAAETGFVSLLQSSSSSCLHLYAAWRLLECDVYVYRRDYRLAAVVLAQVCRLLHHPRWAADLSVEKKSTLSTIYLDVSSRWTALAFYQQRIQDARYLAERHALLARQVGDATALARAYLHLAVAAGHRGQWEEALTQSNNCLETCQDALWESPTWMAAKSFKAHVLLQLVQTSTARSDCLRHHFLALLELKETWYQSCQLARGYGLPPPDHNLLTSQANVLLPRKNTVLSPWAWALSSWHNADPHPCRRENGGIGTESGAGGPTASLWNVQQSAGLRLGPVDIDLSSSPLSTASHLPAVNIYTTWARLQLVASLQLLACLVEIHRNGVFRDWQLYAEDLTEMVTRLADRAREQAARRLGESFYTRRRSTGEAKEGEGRGPATPYVEEVWEILDADDQVTLSPSKILADMLIMAEQSLKILRLCVHVSPQLRAQVLYYAAYARIQHSLTCPSLPAPVEVVALPALAGLHFASQTGFDRLLSRDLCVLLAHLLGSDVSLTSLSSMGGGEATRSGLSPEMTATLAALADPSQRLKWALHFTQQAIRLHHTHCQVSQLAVGGIGMDAAAGADLDRLLVNTFTTSLSSARSMAEEEAAGASQAAASGAGSGPAGKGGKGDGKAKDAAGAKGGAGTTASTPYTSRDGLYLLTSLFRTLGSSAVQPISPLEERAYSLDQALSQDVHVYLQTDDSQYRALPVGAVPIAPNVSVSVAVNAVSSLWTLASAGPGKEEAKTTAGGEGGLYSHAECIFVLGDVVLPTSSSLVAPSGAGKGGGAGKATASSATAAASGSDGSSSSEPALKKVVAGRLQVVALQHRLRSLAEAVQETEKSGGEVSSELGKQCGRAVQDIYQLLRYGQWLSTGDALPASEEGGSYDKGENKVVVSLDKTTFKFTVQSKALWLLADIFSVERAVAGSCEAEVCQLLRLGLGCAKYLRGATGLP